MKLFAVIFVVAVVAFQGGSSAPQLEPVLKLELLHRGDQEVSKAALIDAGLLGTTRGNDRYEGVINAKVADGSDTYDSDGLTIRVLSPGKPRDVDGLDIDLLNPDNPNVL